MRVVRLFFLLLGLGGTAFGLSAESLAAGPRNPYSGFNLSGINYGAQQWDRAQKEGRRVWPYYNTPSRGSSREHRMVDASHASPKRQRRSPGRSSGP